MEKKEQDKFSIDKENLKNETSATIEEVKQTMKQVNLKEDTVQAKGILIELFKNPIHKINEVANSEGTFFKTAIILIILWSISALIQSVADWGSFKYFFTYHFLKNVWSLLELVLAPTVGIVIISLIILAMNKSSKKSLTTIISTVTIARVPIIIASFVELLTIINSEMLKITTQFTGLCSVISSILLYFGIKKLYNKEDDNTLIRTVIIIEGIYYIIKFGISFLGIYL